MGRVDGAAGAKRKKKKRRTDEVGVWDGAGARKKMK